MLVGLSLPPLFPGPPRKEGIGFDNFRMRLAALLFENARLTCVPPARTGGVDEFEGPAGAVLLVVETMLEAAEEEDAGREA